MEPYTLERIRQLGWPYKLSLRKTFFLFAPRKRDHHLSVIGSAVYAHFGCPGKLHFDVMLVPRSTTYEFNNVFVAYKLFFISHSIFQTGMTDIFIPTRYFF